MTPAGLSGILTPKYLILGIVYAPPGNGSSVVYSNGSVSGTTSGKGTINGSAFTLGVQGNVIFTDTASGTTTKSTSLQVNETITQGVQAISTTDQLDHSKDTFYILVHPQLNYQQATPGGPINVSQPGLNSNVIPLILDVNELTGKEPIPLSKKAQLLDLTPHDLATIASTDPLISSPWKFDSNRFHKVDQLQLAGPDYPGAVINEAPYTEADTSTACNSVTNAVQNTVTVGFSAGADFLGQGEKVIATASMTNGLSSSSGNCNGTTSTALFTPRSGTVGQLVTVDVYEDGVFHTFAFAEPPQLLAPIAASAAVRGVLVAASGKPLANQIFTVTFSNGSRRRLATDAGGRFIIAAPPTGALTIRSGLKAQSVTLVSGQKSIPTMTLRATRHTPRLVRKT